MIDYLLGLYIASVLIGFLGIMYSYSYDRATYRDGLLSKVKYDRISRKYRRLLLWLPTWPVGIVYHLVRKRK